MAAVWIQLATELRRRWRAWLGLALLIGLAGGASIAAATGARRTETAYPRFLDRYRAPDVVTGGISGPEEEFAPGLEALKTLPQVAEWADGYALPGEIVTETGRSQAFPQLVALGDAGDARTINSSKILRGRAPNPKATDEATVSFAAEAPDLTIGSPVRLLPAEDAGFPKGLEIALRIVGIHAAPGEFQSINGVSFPSLRVGSGVIRKNLEFLKATPQSNVRSVEFRLKRGAADVEPFRREATRRGILVELPLEMSEHLAGVQKTMRFEGAALWLLAGLVGVSAVAIFGQALTRLSVMEAADYPTLRALGMSRTALTGVGVLRASLIGATAAVFASAVGILASPLTPIGSARLAEPDPGIYLDAAVLIAGAVATLIIVVACSILPSIRAARLSLGAIGATGGDTTSQPSRFAETLARSHAPLSIVSGVRLALEPGKGRTAVPVRTTIAGIAAGGAALIMALTFRASLDVLINSPQLSGYTWDMLVAGDPREIEGSSTSGEIEASGRGGATNISIAGSRMLSFVWDAAGPIRPVILEGRAPFTPNEIALGTKTLRESGLRIGDTVDVDLISSQIAGQSPDAVRASYSIVGRAIIPQLFFEPHEPGEGAAMTLDAYFRLERPPLDDIPVLVRLRPGADLNAVTQRLRKSAFVAVRQSRGDMLTIERLSAIPLVLSGLLAAMAAAALIHALLSTIRRRSRDLAIMKTLGFRRRQVRATVLWQAATLVVVAFACAVPAGIVAGRWLWTLFAEQIAVLPKPVVPIGLTMSLIPAALALAVAVALVPARAAARTKPALVLRTE